MVLVILFVHWVATTPDVGSGSIVPTYFRVVMVAPVAFGFICCGGLLLAFRRQVRDC